MVLGDGNICSYSKGKKVGVYQVKIAGDLNKDRDYHLEYIKPLCEKLFNLNVKEQVYPNERFIALYSKELVKFLEKMGLNAGNKIKNRITIPKWIWKNKSFLKACIRGLIDTDGSIYRLTPNYPNLFQLNFKNNNYTLLKDVRKAFLYLNFIVSRISNNQIYITRQREIKKFYKEIGFSNTKHRNRYSPVV